MKEGNEASATRMNSQLPSQISNRAPTQCFVENAINTCQRTVMMQFENKAVDSHFTVKTVIITFSLSLDNNFSKK